MATQAQIDACRRNLQRSAAKPSAPAHHQTAYSEYPVLPHEDQSQFEDLRTRLYVELDPQGEHETFLADLMAQARWQVLRAARLEAQAFTAMIEGPSNSPDGRIVAAMSEHGDPLAAIQRYAAKAESSYVKAHKDLLLSRKTTAQLASIQAKALNPLLAPVPPRPAPAASAACATASGPIPSQPHTPPPSARA